MKLILTILALYLTTGAYAADTVLVDRDGVTTPVDAGSLSGVATAAQGAKIDALGATVYPSGDTSGVADLANIQAAINALPANGGKVYLVNNGPFYLPSGSTGIQIGNGTASANSSKQGIELVGIGKGGIMAGTNSGVTIFSSVNGPAIQVNGPIGGWGLDNISVSIWSSSASARALKVISARDGNVPFFSVNLYNPSQVGVEETTTTGTSPGSNTMHNKWGHVRIWMSNAATSAVAWKSTGLAAPTFNTCFDTVDDLEVYAPLASQTGIYLGATDTVAFTQYSLYNYGTPNTAIMFDYANGQSANWPADVTFFSLDIGTSTIVNSGTPSQWATKNKIFGMGLTNGGSIPTLANLYTADAPLMSELRDWPAAVSATEVSYLDGVTSAVQTQLSGKQASLTFTGNGTVTVSAPSGGLKTAGKQTTFDANGNLVASSYDVGAVGGGGSGTVSSGTTGQFAYYGADGTTVTGRTLVAGDIPAIPESGVTNLTTDLAAKVIAPATNTANFVPRWSGTNSKTLVDGLAVGTGANNLVQLDGSSKLPAVDGSALTMVGVRSTDSITAIGRFALGSATGGNNTAFGRSALPNVSSGTDNVGVGRSSGAAITTGTSNLAIGTFSLFANQTGSTSVGVGQSTLGSWAPSDGSGNHVAVGVNAGSAITTGTNDTFIGYGSGGTGTTATVSKSIAIGYNAQVTANNTAVIGGSGSDGVTIKNGDGTFTVTTGGDVSAKTFTPTIPAATTYAATTTIDLSLGDSPSVTLTGNPTLAFSNPKAGQWHRLNIIQGASGGPYTVTWPSTGLVCSWRNTSGHTAPTLLTAAGAVDTIVIHTLSTTSAECWTTGNL